MGFLWFRISILGTIIDKRKQKALTIAFYRKPESSKSQTTQGLCFFLSFYLEKISISENEEVLLPGLLPLSLRPEQPVGLGCFANIWRREKITVIGSMILTNPSDFAYVRCIPYTNLSLDYSR